MKTMYLESYMAATSEKRLTIEIRDKTVGDFMACSGKRIEYLQGYRRYRDLIVDYIDETRCGCHTIVCHLSPTMKKAGFNKNDYINKEEA